MLMLPLMVLLAAPRPPPVDVAVKEVCDTASPKREFCSLLTLCSPFKKGVCRGDNRLTRTETDDKQSWHCELDVRNGYLTCTSDSVSVDGPGEGDVFTSKFDVALFTSKKGPMIAISSISDRPEAWFFMKTDSKWQPAQPLPPLTPAAFALKEPKAPQKGPTADDSSNGFNAKFFVELSLPQHGTTVMAEGRWVNTYRDDSGYGQSDTQLSSATLSLTWNAAAAKFER